MALYMVYRSCLQPPCKAEVLRHSTKDLVPFPHTSECAETELLPKVTFSAVSKNHKILFANIQCFGNKH